MLDENEGLWKGPVLKVRKYRTYCIVYYISEDQSGSPKNLSFPEPSFSSSMRRKKLAGSENEIELDTRELKCACAVSRTLTIYSNCLGNLLVGNVHILQLFIVFFSGFEATLANQDKN